MITILDFWAPWCQPCKQMSPVIEKLEKEFPQVAVRKINIDQQPEVALDHGVMSIPTLIIQDEKGIIAQFTGVVPEAAIRKALM